MSARFVGKHVLVTGGGRGIGRSIALAFAREGARISIFARTQAHLAEVVEGASSEGLAIRPFVCDVTDRARVEAVVAAARQDLGAADVLVNNAGFFLYKPFLETSPAEWDRVVATNLGGAYNFSRAVLPEMIERKSGRIVNVSSIHGLHGDANLTALCAAKFGLIGLTQALAREVRPSNVTVNAVCPGTTDNRTPDSELSPRSMPLSDKLRPQDVASAVTWLCTDEACGITGAAIEVYGGTHLKIQP